MKAQYAVYIGDDFIFMGTVDEVAEGMGWKPQTVYFYATPVHHERTAKRKNPAECVVVIRVEDD